MKKRRSKKENINIYPSSIQISNNNCPKLPKQSRNRSVGRYEHSLSKTKQYTVNSTYQPTIGYQ